MFERDIEEAGAIELELRELSKRIQRLRLKYTDGAAPPHCLMRTLMNLHSAYHKIDMAAADVQRFQLEVADISPKMIAQDTKK